MNYYKFHLNYNYLEELYEDAGPGEPRGFFQLESVDCILETKPFDIERVANDISSYTYLAKWAQENGQPDYERYIFKIHEGCYYNVMPDHVYSYDVHPDSPRKVRRVYSGYMLAKNFQAALRKLAKFPAAPEHEITARHLLTVEIPEEA